MASARELLDKADALMRRNRSAAAVATDTEIPVLTEAIPMAEPDDADFPVLTDAVNPAEAEVQPPAAAPAAVAATPPPSSRQESSSPWPGPDTLDRSPNTVSASESQPVAGAPGMSSRAVGSQPTPPPRGSEPSPPAREPSPARSELSRASSEPSPPGSGPAVARPHDAQAAEADFVQSGSEDFAEDDDLPSASVADPALDDELKWQALAEQISMQVLQRIDLFTDSGLKQQLAAHLQPIVDRASAELVASINDHVGRLLRTYVAEAIEREIAQWRDENR